MNDQAKAYLRQMLDAHINEDSETAKTAFHDYVVDKSKSVMEMEACSTTKTAVGDGGKDPKQAPGCKEVKSTMKRGKEIGKSGESAADPKSAKGASEVKKTMKRGKTIPKKGESAADPKAAPGDKGVKATMAKADDVDITAKKG